MMRRPKSDMSSISACSSSNSAPCSEPHKDPEASRSNFFGKTEGESIVIGFEDDVLSRFLQQQRKRRNVLYCKTPFNVVPRTMSGDDN